jgi:hypothetical protein
MFFKPDTTVVLHYCAQYYIFCHKSVATGLQDCVVFVLYCTNYAELNHNSQVKFFLPGQERENINFALYLIAAGKTKGLSIHAVIRGLYTEAKNIVFCIIALRC